MEHMTKWIIGILALLILGALAIFAYVTWWQPKDEPNKESAQSSFDEQIEGTRTRTFTSAKGVSIEIDDWPVDGIVTNPLTITGKVPGSWASEGSFPIGVVYEGDIGLPGTTATLKGDGMTDAMVPFTATLTFDETTTKSNYVMIILRNANPSGLPENDDSVSIGVHFAQ